MTGPGSASPARSPVIERLIGDSAEASLVLGRARSLAERALPALQKRLVEEIAPSLAIDLKAVEVDRTSAARTHVGEVFALTVVPSSLSSDALTMVMDKGLSLEEAKNLISASDPHLDIVKLGFGTAFVTPNLRQKIELYQKAGIPVYFGGTLFEAFLIRNQFNDYIQLCKDYDIHMMEVSDGSIIIPHTEKCGYIEKLTKHGKVLSEVGSKDATHIMPPYKWIELMKAELEAGSSYVIAEAREAGNVGIYRGTGEVREGLVQEILTQIPSEKIIWEAPQKAQQLYFLELLGCNVNLGNISPQEIIPLEAMRIGLRGNTFHLYLDQEA